MVSSWFRSDAGKGTVQDVVKALYPKNKGEPDRARFSQLILEHGEKVLQDWAVAAYSFPEVYDLSSPCLPQQKKGVQWEQSPRKAHGQKSRRNSSQSSHFVQNGNASVDKDLYPTLNMTKTEGRLHLCSGSIIFEPTDTSRAIVRCSFQFMTEAPKEYPVDHSFAAMCIDCSVSKHVVIWQSHQAFESVPVPARFQFTFLHSTPTMFVALCQELFLLGQQSRGAKGASAELDQLLQPMMDRPFNINNLVDVREQVLSTHLRCQSLKPLQVQPGVLVVTVDRIYFQPAIGVLDESTETRAISWPQRDVLATARRYKGLQDSALEIYWKDGCSTLLAFERRHHREQVLRELPNYVPCLTDRDFVVQVAHEWQQKTISNYEYLLAVNSAAGRSFHDLSRYPVFPWVVADYDSAKLDLNDEKTFRDLSKPVGALNEHRLQYFRTRLEGMEDMEEAFLYGTHYSAPGYVLFYLARSMPEHMLCLQNGKFDAPDRMFDSIKRCFNCALTNHADVKELIPEFYNAHHDFDFLINARGLQLGAMQNGDRVNDVELPPWARSARDFIKKNRSALESEICTRQLPRWIDLIFGCKSRGEGALQAMNLFHRTAYLGPRDLADMASEEERLRAELQATEFGIVPDLLFCGSHPTRDCEITDDAFVAIDVGRASSKEEFTAKREAWELLDPPSNTSHEENFTGQVKLSLAQQAVDRANSQKEIGHQSDPSQSKLSGPHGIGPSSGIISTKGEIDRSLPLQGIGESLVTQAIDTLSSLPSPKRTELARSPSQESLPQVENLRISTSSTPSDWDMKIIERKRIHNDSISGCVLYFESDDETLSPMLATTSLDGGLMVHKICQDSSPEGKSRGFSSTLTRFSYNTIMSRGLANQSPQTKLEEYRTHASRDPLACLVLAVDGSGGQVAFAGGHDDVVLAYGINSSCAVASLYSHRDAVTGLALISRTPLDSDNALWLEGSTHILVSGSWDATVKVWSTTVASGETVSISREPLAELFDADSSIVCVSAKVIPTGGVVIGAGCADGSLIVWNVHSDGVQVVIHSEPARRGSGACSVVEWTMESGSLHLFAAFATGKIASYSLTDGVLRRKSAVSVGVAILSIAYAKGSLLVGCADGGLRLIAVRDGACFDTKPTLWRAVNHQSAPGISSISISCRDRQSVQAECICCTGGADGSIALFELKRTQPLL
jgi:factor associated with neutral sphingomyelinase activation